MLISFNFPLLNLDGSEVLDIDNSPAIVSKLISRWIMQSASKNPAEIMKFWNWAQELYKKGTIDLDQAGRSEFKNFIENLDSVGILAKGVILEKLNYLE